MDAPGRFLVLSATEPGSKTREYHRRKFHTKDRLGCLTCKQRRIKCDKAKPVCTRCTRVKRECQYGAADQDRLEKGFSPAATTLAPTQFWSALVAESLLEPQMHAAGITTGQNATPIGALLSHIAQDLGRGGFLTLVPLSPALWDLSCQHHHLLAAILAVSACHLSNHAPNASAHRMAEYSLSTAACKLFRSAVSQPPKSRAESDALLLTAMMLNTLAFAAVEDASDISQSWVFSDDEDRLGWLSLQTGLRPLLMATKEFRSESLLQFVFAASVCHAPQGSEDNRGYDSTDVRHWEGHDSSLAEPARVLGIVRRLAPLAGNLFRYVQFVGALGPEFLQLLHDRDEHALWMFGFWLGLIGRLPGMWWFSRRVQRDRTAIWRFLHKKGVCEREGGQGVLWRQRMDEYRAIDNDSIICQGK